MQIRVEAGEVRCLPVFDSRAQNCKRFVAQWSVLAGKILRISPPLDSDEEYVKYRIKIWTVIDRKRI